MVGKDVRVVEEIGIRKEAADRIESMRDTKVDVQDTSAIVCPTTTTTSTTDTTKRI